MGLKYRGADYSTDQRDDSVSAKTLTYRGQQYFSQPKGTCRKVDVVLNYRGIKHTENKLVCA